MKRLITILVTVAMLASLSYMVGGNSCFNTQVCAEDASRTEKSELDEQLEAVLSAIYDIAMEDENALGIPEIDMVFDAVESILGTSDMDNARAVLEKLEFDIENSGASDSAKAKISEYIKNAIAVTNGGSGADISTEESTQTSEIVSAPESDILTESSVGESTGSSSAGMIIGIIACVIAVAVAAVVIIMRIKKRPRD